MMLRPAGALASGVGQDQRAIPNRAEQHRPLNARETQERQRHALQDTDRIEVHGDSDREGQAIRRQIARGLRRRLEGHRWPRRPERGTCPVATEPAKPSRYASRAAGPHPRDSRARRTPSPAGRRSCRRLCITGARVAADRLFRGSAGERQPERGHLLAVAHEQQIADHHRMVPGLALDRRKLRRHSVN